MYNTFASIMTPKYRKATEPSEPSGYELTILTPTEAEEVGSDFTLAWEDNTTNISITSPTENEEVGSDFTLEFETDI